MLLLTSMVEVVVLCLSISFHKGRCRVDIGPVSGIAIKCGDLLNYHLTPSASNLPQVDAFGKIAHIH